MSMKLLFLFTEGRYWPVVMLTHSMARFLRQLALWRLLLEVHLDAFRLNPGPYLTASKWWILRKRVRARGQFGPLLGQSSKAYELWAAIHGRRADLPPTPPAATIVALVERERDEADLTATMDSLAAAGIAAHVLEEPARQSLEALVWGVLSESGAWLLPIRAGDIVAHEAVSTYATAIAQAGEECTVIYADDDIIDASGRRKNPYFKPDWNAELQRHHDFLTSACILRASAVGPTDSAPDDVWDRSLVALAAGKGTVTHVRTVLHHRKSRSPAPVWAQPLAVADALLPISVIVPTRNRVDLLRTCIEGLRSTRYPSMEIIVANNDSDEPATLEYLEELANEGVKILDQPGPFNYSTINNNAVAIANGELICLMNNDIEVLSPDWLEIMATQAMRPEVGAVGAQLLYPDGRIQHAGVVIGVGNAAGHAHRFLRPAAEGYFRRHALPQYVSAVTAACLVVRRDRFLAAGGLDEANFAVAFNDVDLCLRLNLRGWQSLYEPRAVLVHHESVSRGQDTDPVGAARFARELAALQRIWRTHEITDPFHHPMLSRASEQFALDLASTMVPA